MQTCSAIVPPNQAQFVVLPSSPDIRSAQEHDQPLQNGITHHRSSATRFKPELIEGEDGTSLWADVSYTPARIRVPTSLYRIVFDRLYRIAHPGLKAGQMLIKRSYWWQGIIKDVVRWTQLCAVCQKAKIHVHTNMPLERLTAPTKRVSHIHIDLVGPLHPPCEGKKPSSQPSTDRLAGRRRFPCPCVPLSKFLHFSHDLTFSYLLHVATCELNCVPVMFVFFKNSFVNCITTTFTN